MVSRRQSSTPFRRRYRRGESVTLLVARPLEPVAPSVAQKKPSLIRRYKESDAWLWTEVAAVVIGLAFVIPTAIALWIDLEDRQTQRIAQAWESVTREAPGNAGKGSALEYLISQGIPLVGINLSAESNQSPSYLVKANLSGAILYDANLSDANLTGANLQNAILKGAILKDSARHPASFEQSQLDTACGDEKTQLPEGFTIKVCAEK